MFDASDEDITSVALLHWRPELVKKVLDFWFVRDYLKGELDHFRYLQHIEQFLPDMVDAGLKPWDIELLKNLMSSPAYTKYQDQLGKIHPDRSLEPIDLKEVARNLVSDVEFYRSRATSRLSLLPPCPIYRLVIHRLGDQDPHVVENSLAYLSQCPETGSLIKAFLWHEKMRFAQTVFDRYEHDMDPDHSQILGNALHHKSADIRRRAIKHIGTYGYREHFDAVRALVADSDKEVRVAATACVQSMSQRIEDHPLYVRQSDDFFTSFSRAEFDKDGNRTILLGGNFVGKAVMKVVYGDQYRAWHKAYFSKEFWEQKKYDYIPVEPILVRKDGAPRARQFRAQKQSGKNADAKKPLAWYETLQGGEERFAVFTRILGKTLFAFLLPKERRRYQRTLEMEMGKIVRLLSDLGINYSWDPSHIDTHNFCVDESYDPPRLYIIDFDNARLVS